MNYRARTLPEFLGSMRLAVTLLAALAVASVAGTVLQQNQPYNDYLAKFGPYWFRVYQSLGLFDVYHAPWFLAVLAFLVLSVGVCVSRNARRMARQLLRGQWRRLGYLSAHIGVVVVAVGGLVDGNLPLLLANWRGEVVAETRNLPLSEVPKRSFLSAANPAFRGRVNIPESAKSGAVFVNMGDGYLVQPLPFTVELADFRVRHYDTGQPKSFESDLLIHDPDLKSPLARTIRVNHPLTHKGVTIYQASFSDGGSSLAMRMWPLHARLGGDAATVHGTVGKSLSLTPGLRLELDDFRLFNVVNRAAADVKQPDLRNVGPSFQFRLRRADGSAAEFHNYMLPVAVDGRRYYLSGVRESPADEFNYLHIPEGPAGSIARFARLAALLHDAATRNAVADQISATALQMQDAASEDSRRAITEKTRQLFTTFTHHGLAAVQEQLAQEAPPAQVDNLLAAYFNILRLGVAELYRRAIKDEGEGAPPAADFADHFTALAALGRYPAPLYLQLQSFDQVQASGLEVTRSPGQPLVYAGCALLVAGIFLMLFTARAPRPRTTPPR